MLQVVKGTILVATYFLIAETVQPLLIVYLIVSIAHLWETNGFLQMFSQNRFVYIRINRSFAVQIYVYGCVSVPCLQKYPILERRHKFYSALALLDLLSPIE